MKLIKRTILGFEFVKAGDFVIADNPHPVIFNGKQDHINVCIELVDDLFLKSDESAYLIYVDEKLVYVGEFSYNMRERWLRKKNYIWHNTDIKIEEQLRFPHNKKVSLWLTVDPYVVLHSSLKMNISKSIEQEILRQLMPPWNTRGQMKKWSDWRAKNCVPVSDIICKAHNYNNEPLIAPDIGYVKDTSLKDSADVEVTDCHTALTQGATNDIAEPSKIDEHIKWISDLNLQSIFNSARKRIIGIAPNAEEYLTKDHVCYKHRGRQIAWLTAYRKSFNVGVIAIGERRVKLSEREVKIATVDDDFAEILEDIEKSYLNLEI